MKTSARYNYIIFAYLIGIAVFTLFRLAGTAVYLAANPSAHDFGGLYWHALLMGWRFDTAVSCYLLALPALMMIIAELAHIRSKAYHLVAHHLLLIGYIVSFFACTADIPFFAYFFTRLNATAINEIDSFGIIAHMIISEPMYLAGIGAFLAIAVGYWFLMRLLLRRTLLCHLDRFQPYALSIPLALLLIFATFVGMRGRLSKKSPLRVGTAYFCSDPFLNQIGLNPVFTFIKSASELGKQANQPISYLPPQTVQQALLDLQHTPADSSLMPPGLDLPLPQGTNVVLIIMESMTVEKTGLSTTGCPSLTPCLDSLIDQSLTFTRAYSSGIHTYCGVYSTLYSRPCIPSRHTMKQATIPQVHGLPQVLHQAGYHTAYFMTHDEDFDNMRGFLFGNGFDSVIGQHNYPPSQVIGTWGVPDHVMFDHALLHCNQAAAHGPFFTAIMTCSDHAPYAIPQGIPFHPRSSEMNKQIVEYADWALGRFMRMARRQPWYANTLFVLIADHGGVWGTNRYDMPLTYHHIPILFHNPAHLAPQRLDRLAMQVDLGPTLLAMLPIQWDNTTFGLDLLTQPRPYAYFCNDDKIGVIDPDYFYIFRTAEGIESLHLLSDTTAADLLANPQPALRHRADNMKHYGLGLTQASDLTHSQSPANNTN